MVTRRPVGAVSQLAPGQFVDKERNLWTGTWDSPQWTGTFSGQLPSEGNWVPVPEGTIHDAPSGPTYAPPLNTTDSTQPTSPPRPVTPTFDGPSPQPIPYGPDTRQNGLPPGVTTVTEPGGGIRPRTVTMPTLPPGITTTTTPGITTRSSASTTATTPPSAAPPPTSAAPHTAQGARDLLLEMLNGLGGQWRNDPQGAIDQINQKFGDVLPPGHQPALYVAGSHGAGSRATIGFDDGYLAQNADGSWGWVARTEGPGGGGGGTNNQPSDYSWADALSLANQHAGHTLTAQEVTDLTRMFGPGNQGADYHHPDRVTREGLQPVLDYLDAHHSGGPGGPIDPGGGHGTPINPNGPYGGPGTGGVFGNGPNVQQVGQDPLSLLLSNGLAGLILSGGQGVTDFGDGVRTSLLDLLGHGGRFNTDTEALNLETARGVADRARNAEMSGIRGQLANRGLLSEPGHPQGQELDAANRLEERTIAPIMANAVQQYLVNEGNNASQRFQTALSTGANLSNADNRTMLDAINGGTSRQQVLGDLAIKELEQNRLFNQFLAQYGLDVDKFMNEIQTGNTTQMMALLQQFLALAGLSGQGFV